MHDIHFFFFFRKLVETRQDNKLLTDYFPVRRSSRKPKSELEVRKEITSLVISLLLLSCPFDSKSMFFNLNVVFEIF